LRRERASRWRRGLSWTATRTQMGRRQSDGPSFSRGFACVCGLYERHAAPQETLFDRRRPHDPNGCGQRE
jgi:hypothetical protein